MGKFFRSLAFAAVALCGLLPFESAAQISNTFSPDVNWCSTRGSIATRKASSWQCLTPGSSGQVLQSGGAGADVSWLTVTGSGTVTSVAQTVPSFMSVTGSPITGSGTLALSFNSQTAATVLAAPTGSAAVPSFRTLVYGDLPTIAAGALLANATGGAAAPAATTLTAILDNQIGSTQGQIAYRNAAGWVALAPGIAGQYLQTGGAAANPVWAAVSGASGGTVTSVAIGASTGLSATANPITLSGTISGVAMTGATSGVAGAMGMVPQPIAGDQNKYLRGDGTWNAGNSVIVPDVQVLTASTGTYTVPAGARALRIRGLGAGGGGGGNTTGGSAGGSSTWAALLTLTGGGGGGAEATTANGAAGGTSTGCTLNVAGAPGVPANAAIAGLPSYPQASSQFGASGVAIGGAVTSTATASTGYGVGGNGGHQNTGNNSGSGANGGYCEHWITSGLAASYSYATGAAGAGGTGTRAGAAGMPGVWIVEAY